MGVRKVVVVFDSDDEHPPCVGIGEEEEEGCPESCGRWQKTRQDVVAAGGSTKRHHAVSADRSSKRHDAVAASGWRKHEDAISAAGSRNCRHAVSAAGSRKREAAIGDGGSRKRRHAISAAGSRKRRHAVSAVRSRKRQADGGSRKRRHAVSAGGSTKSHDAVAAARTRKEIRKLSKSYIATGHTAVSTVEMTMIWDFLASLFTVYGCADGTCSVVVHTLTDTDVKKKQMKIHRRAVPDDLALCGPVTVVFHPDATVVGSYNVLTEDHGRVKVCCWRTFIDQVGWKAKMKIVMLFCHRDDMTWLFLDPLDAVVMA
ncbi:hypothetical protein ACQ4PT_071552 [Festuca glaucescens]